MDKPVEKVLLAAETRVFADPANLPADGVVGVRTLLPEDHQRLRAMFSRLSSQSIYRRFYTPYPRVPEWMTEFLMDADRRGGRSLQLAPKGW